MYFTFTSTPEQFKLLSKTLIFFLGKIVQFLIYLGVTNCYDTPGSVCGREHLINS